MAISEKRLRPRTCYGHWDLDFAFYARSRMCAVE